MSLRKTGRYDSVMCSHVRTWLKPRADAVARFGCTDMLVQNRAGYRPVVFLRELVAEGSTIYACEVEAYRKQP